MEKKQTNNKRYYPLTHAQKRIFYDDKIYVGTSVGTQAFVLRYRRKLDPHLLEQAIGMVIEKYDGFRIRIEEIDHVPQQYIKPYEPYTLERLNFSGPDEGDRLEEWLQKTTRTPLQILGGELFYFAFLQLEGDSSGYYMKFHHAASDGWSYGLIFNDIDTLYEALEKGETPTVKPGTSYTQYIAEEMDYLKSDQFKKDKEYWHNTLLPLPNPLNLSPKKGDPHDNSGSVYNEDFPDDVRAMMLKYCMTTRTSVFKLIMAVLSMYVARISGLEDVAVATVNHNRVGGNRKGMVGMTVSTVPLRVDVGSQMTFNEMVAKCGSGINFVLKNHQEYPFDRLAVELRDAAGRDVGYLMDVLVSGHGDFKNDKYDIRHIFQGHLPNSMNIHLYYPQTADGLLEMEYEYRLAHYAEADIARLHKGLVELLANALGDPEKKIGEIELLSPQSKEQILYDFNKTDAPFPNDKTLHRLFEEQVQKAPENMAALCGDNSLSYLQLNRKANCLAGQLREKGVHTDYIVGIYIEPSLDKLVAILAVLKAGGAYLPVEKGTPKETVRFQLEESEAQLLLSREELADDISFFSGETIHLEPGLPCIDKNEAEGKNLEPLNSPGDLAFVIYTSGATGQSKGVALEHRGVVNTLSAIQQNYPVEPGGGYLLNNSFRFELAVPQLFGWFLGGGRVVMLEASAKDDPAIILETIHEYGLSHLNVAPTLFNRMLYELKKEGPKVMEGLKYIFLSGEAVVPEMIRRFRGLNTETVLVNLFGAAETSVYATVYGTAHWTGTGSIPVGTPLNNTKSYILTFIDNEPVLLPIGVPGELCFAGVGLGRGYLKKPGLTEERFIDNPFGDGGKLFRTGELARWLPDGNIEYLGRIDRQLYIRETRLERIDIEDLILRDPRIIEALVVAREDKAGVYLCAYVVSDEEINTAVLRENLMDHLPGHLIPSYFMQIRALPLTPDGRADRGELLDLKHDPHQIESILAEIEAEVLHLQKSTIDLDDNFFQLGGHSYKAAQMASKIHKALNVKLSMAELFKRPTLRQLSEYLTEAIEVKYASIEPAEIKEYYPQSSAQKRLYFLHQLEEEDVVYNIQMIDIYCKGLEKEKLEAAFKALIRRHESLRTSFHLIEEQTLQKIHPFEDVETTFNIEYYEANEEGKIFRWPPETGESGQPAEGRDFQEVIQSFIRPFDLAVPPLIRVGFIKILGDTNILVMDMHHIVADGISMEILAKELWKFYDGKELAPLRLQYRDFSEWLNTANSVETVKEQETFWLNEFAGEIPLINLPTDYPRPSKLTFDGDTLEFAICPTETRILNLIAQAHGESLYMVLFSAYNVLLNKISGQEDIVVGTVTAGRGHDDLQGIVGMFLNTLALRNYPEGEKVFEDFLMNVKLTAFAAFDNQDYPFEQLVSHVASRQDTGRNPLFDVAFGLENEADPSGYLMEVAVPDKAKPYDFDTHKAKFDMTLLCIEVDDGMECTIEYKTKLFKTETIQRISRYFKTIVSSVCSNLRQKIGEIEIISTEEKQEIIHRFNDTLVDYPRDKTIHEMFETCVEKTPDNIALSFKGETMTYREVNRKANQLAGVLRGKGVKPDNMVGIMVERCMEMIVGIFAINKAGGAYLPVDPNYPEDRIRYLFKDSSANLLLTLNRFIEFAGTVDFEGEIMDLEDESLYEGDGGNIDNVNGPSDLAYIIYTSGSTGKPKGVTIEHVAAVNLLLTLDEMYPLEAGDSYLLKTAFLFDVSVSEIYGWFWRGAKLSILEQGGEKDPLRIMECIEEEKVTHLNFVPSMFNVFVSMLDTENIGRLATLRYIFLAGEAIWPDSVLKFREFGTATKIENLYGPTEATVYASWYPVGLWGGGGSVSIGKSVTNLKLYILSSDNKARPALQPVGIAGELTISGIQLARGYLNRPELTSEMFVNNPFAAEEKGDKAFEKLYHTGDLCRWYADGNIEYMGRIDHQVKVRGFRIELGEIEAQLMNLDEVDEAIVIVREDNEGEKYLCAYLMSAGALNMTSVRERLSEHIPNYMVPSYFVQIDKIPLNPNGKLDRKALPEPESQAFATEYAAPTNEVEELLAGVWAEVLGSKQVGIDDNFFEIGGDSIKTIMISAKLQKQGVSISVNDFFTSKTIRHLAERSTMVEVETKPEKAVSVDKEGIARRLKEGYEAYLEKMNGETLPDLKVEEAYKHVLLTGSTGYLGAYLAYELLTSTDAKLYLPVRGNTQREAEARLAKQLGFYFGDDFVKKHKDRLVVLLSDLRAERAGIEAAQYDKMCDTVEVVIHSAANVKHYGAYEEFYKDNVQGTETLLEFALTGKKKDFHYVSTLSVAFGNVPGKDALVFTEYSLDEGQEIGNVYARSKLEAEKLVVSYRDKGLNTSIHRAGNMTFNADNGKFQENIDDNFTYSMMKALITVGFWSEKMRALEFDLSYVNYAARAMISLVKRKGLKNEVFHICNPHILTWKKMAQLLEEVGVDVADSKVKEGDGHLARYEGNSEYEKIIERVKLYSWIWETEAATQTAAPVDRTVKILEQIGFQWPEPGKERITRMMEHCRNVGFL